MPIRTYINMLRLYMYVRLYSHIVVRSVSRAHFSLARSIHSHVRRSFDRRRWSHSAPSIKISIHINNTYVPFCIPQIETSQPINLFQKISIFNAINTIYIFIFFQYYYYCEFILSFIPYNPQHTILHAEKMIATPSTVDTGAAAAGTAATWAGLAGWRSRQLGHICCWYLSSL